MIPNQREITLERTFSPGQWNDDGTFQKGEVSSETVLASLQPMSGNEIQRLPEGRRNKKSLKVFSAFPLNIANAKTGLAGDILVINNERYEVWQVMDWTNAAQPVRHYSYICQLVSELVLKGN